MIYGSQLSCNPLCVFFFQLRIIYYSLIRYTLVVTGYGIYEYAIDVFTLIHFFSCYVRVMVRSWRAGGGGREEN